MRRNKFMTSAERKALMSPAPKSSLPIWNPASGEPYNGYRHAPKINKGQRDGSCNRTACQRDLKGMAQYYMRGDLDKSKRVYYCGECAEMFSESDRRYQPNQPLRCTLDPETL